MPQIIPGWSTTTANFNKIEKNQRPSPVLISGEAGCMQEHYAKRLKRKGQSVVEVDAETKSIKVNNVAATNSRANQANVEAQPYHLDSLRRAKVEDENSHGSRLQDSLVGQFGCHLFVPPLRNRLIDVLAWVHAFGQYRKRQPTLISTRMLHALFFDSVWSGNDQGLLYHLAACLNEGSAVLDVEPAFMLRQPNTLPNFLALDAFRYQAVPRHQSTVLQDWHCLHDANVPTCRLPNVALRMFFAAFHASLGESEAEKSIEPLGNPEYWLELGEQSDLTEVLPLGDCDLLTHYSYGLTPKRGWSDRILGRLENFRFFGASLASLRVGFELSSSDIIGDLVGYVLSPPKAQKVGSKRGKPITKAEKDMVDMHYTDGMSQGQIAKKLNCSKQHVSKTLKSAREKLPQLDALPSRSRSVKTQSLTWDAGGDQ